MELDYFKMRLQSYLREHGFEPAEINSDIVSINADNANDTFETSRRAGHSVDESIELANKDLFSGIGESHREVFAEILLTKFNDRLNVKDQLFLEFWIGKLRERDHIVEGFMLENGLGLDPSELEESRGVIIHRIDQYLKINGL